MKLKAAIVNLSALLSAAFVVMPFLLTTQQARAATLSDGKNALQTSLNTLATLEAHRDYPGWRKRAQLLFAPSAIITTNRSQVAYKQNLAQYLASEQRNMTLMAAAQGTVEHDYVQSFQLLPAQQAEAVSELTTHTHEPVDKQVTSVDFVIRREYALQQQAGSWRIIRLNVTVIGMSLNGKSISLMRPKRQLTHR